MNSRVVQIFDKNWEKKIVQKTLFVSILTIVLLALVGCAVSSTTPPALSDSDQIATIVAGTLSAIPSATSAPSSIATPSTSDSPTSPDSFDLTVNGQLQGMLAFIRNDNLWVSINGVETQLTTDAISTELPYFTGLSTLSYSNPKVSPDGTKVAYLKNSDSTEARVLMVSDIDGKNARQLADDVAWILPKVEWLNDSQRIYYPVRNGIDSTAFSDVMMVKSVNMTTGDLLEHGQFFKRSGCGGGSSDVADHVSAGESMGTLGRGKIFILSPKNDYVMHSTTCSNGLGILNLSTSQDIILDDGNVSAAAVSADGMKIAAISGNNIVIFNVIGGNIEQTYPTVESPWALTWDSSGTAIFYSTSKSVGTRNLDRNVASEVFGISPMTITLRNSMLWKLSLENGENIKIIDMDAHELKPIFVAEPKMLVAVIENTNAFFDYLELGNRENLAEHYPSVNLVEIDLDTLTSSVIIQKTEQADYFAAQ